MPISSPPGRAISLAAAVVTVGAGAILSGCAPTQASLEQKAPVVTAQSSRTVAELAACMSDNLSKYRESSISYVPRPDGASLTYSFVGAPMLTVTIIDQGASRSVNVFERAMIAKKVGRHRLEAVRTCL